MGSTTPRNPPEIRVFPPRCAFCSIRMTSAPSSEALTAAARPAPPAPTTKTSQLRRQLMSWAKAAAGAATAKVVSRKSLRNIGSLVVKNMNLAEESVELNNVFAVELVKNRASPVFNSLL